MSVACPYCGGPMDFLTVTQVAEVLGVSRKTVRKYVAQGRFPGTETLYKVRARKEFRIPATAVLPLVGIGGEKIE